MRIYLKQNVFDEALDRIRWLFDEFDNVIVSVSGGKDSTVIYELALMVAREKNRLPLKVMFIDQEAEWQATIDVIEGIMNNPDVEPYWYQMPLKIFNATSSQEEWLMCWDEDKPEGWMRPKFDKAITENVYGTDRFKELFGAIVKHEYKGQRVCYLAGVRAEESPERRLGMTGSLTYQDATWGRKLNNDGSHVTMYPIYDWSYTDVWAAIHKNSWKYNKIYDVMYSHGVSIHAMRVSNVHHETAIKSLYYLQEMEPDTYEKLTQRIQGIDSCGKLNMADFLPKKLPYMFTDWKDYRDFLLEKMIPEHHQASFLKQFKAMEMYEDDLGSKLWKVQVNCILTNDYHGTRMGAFRSSPEVHRIRKRLKAEKEAQANAE